ncbi:RidA family protein [Paraburkholderia phenoliruptrix]|uniref:RidA family protein n=1 Tax=Paraburkholderia phenoliruptrix TaxID=252970 RepID=A0ABV3WMI8_9BURK
MTREIIDTGLPQFSQPFSWATKAGGILFTAHGPVTADGKLSEGTLEEQTRLTFANLRQAVIASGIDMSDVAQVLIYMKEASHMPTIDPIYREFFAAPYPNRSSVVVKDFVHPQMLIEIVAYAAVPLNAA